MENKRSKGILFVSWFIIVLAYISLFFAYRGYGFWTIQNTNLFSKIICLVMLILKLAEIILALKLSKFKEWARKNLIKVLFLVIFVSLLSLISTINAKNNVWQYIESTRGKEYSELHKEEIERSGVSKQRAEIRALLVWIIGIPAIWRLLVIIYLTRPKVKEQFI